MPMTAKEYSEWMQRAFLYVEAALAMELATPTRAFMTEDYFRASLARGLAQSSPESARRVVVEQDAQWTRRHCWNCPKNPGKGRSIQHDVAVEPDSTDEGLVCEVKWLKSGNARMTACDLWKLALTRSTVVESKAIRCYLLLGGESKPLSRTLKSLRECGLDLRWSRAGGRGTPKTSRDFSLKRFLKSPLGKDALDYQLSWGDDPRHRRTPPNCWETIRVSRRGDPWVRTCDKRGWRAVLFEIHHHGVKCKSPKQELDFTEFKKTILFTC